uniref:Uncharacterized protein n=1 Tax=Rhizophora mucronata TaxID=61149 RepID=A0A2P2N0B5_RHIMU
MNIRDIMVCKQQTLHMSATTQHWINHLQFLHSNYTCTERHPFMEI